MNSTDKQLIKNFNSHFPNLYVVVGWCGDSYDCKDEATVSDIFVDFESARKCMIRCALNDVDDPQEDIVDWDEDMITDKTLECIYINNGVRGYYIKKISINTKVQRIR